MNFWEKLLGKDRPLRIKRRKKETVDSGPKPAPKVADDRQSDRADVGPTPGQTQRDRLLELVVRCFNADEVRDLCFELGVNYNDLSGEGHIVKSRELLRYLERDGRIDEFVAACSRLRPNAPWDTPAAPRDEPYDRRRLLRLVVRYFNADELRDLCLELEVDFDNLPGVRKANKSRELLSYLKRDNRIEEFVATCSRLRPNAPWDTPTAPGYESYSRDRLADFHRALKEHFDEDQVRELCTSLEVDYRRLPYVDQGGATRELVLYLARRERLAELVQVCSQRRPDVSWTNILDRKDEQPTVDNAQPVGRVELRQMLTHFDENHLRDLCLELGVDYDDMHNTGKQAKIRELMAYFERRERTAELAAACSRRRSDVT